MPSHTSNRSESRRFSEQRGLLRRFMSDPPSLATAEIKIGLSKLRPEIARRIKGPPSSESQDFVASAMRSLGDIKGTSNIELRIQCLFDCAIYSYNNGDTPGFLRSIQLLDELCKYSQSSSWNRRIQMFGGVCHADIGNVAEAVMRYAAALDIAHRTSDIPGEVATLCNLGGALNYGGLHREAIPSLRLAIRLAQDHRDIVECNEIEGQKSYFQCVALTNIAQSYHMVGNNDAALDAISHCLSLTPPPVSSLSATSLLLRVFTFVSVALDLGLAFKANDRIAHALKYKMQAGVRGQFMLSVSQALCQVHAGKFDDGISQLEDLLAIADLASTKAAVLRALARACDLSGRPSKALTYVEMLIQSIRETRSRTIAVLLAALPARMELATEADDLVSLRLARADYQVKAAENEVVNARIETLERLAITADLKEETSGGHGHRVGKLASIFCSTLGWDKSACHSIDLAGRLHDIGKIGLPDRLMLKPDTLAAAEHRYVAAHTEIGFELLAQGSGDQLEMARDVAHCHHEQWDGSGYPLGLAEHQIPISARIVALVDVFDALTHGRPYSSPSGPMVALNVIREELGKQFDPDIGHLFIDFMINLLNRNPNIDRLLGESDQANAFSEARRRIGSLLRRANDR